MKNKLPTVTISIPAYNEERNIECLLSSLLKQKKRNISVENILVYSDGSTDRTDALVTGISKKSRIVHLKKGNQRIGKFERLNQIFKDNRSDILIILDADIELNGLDFLEKLSDVVIKDKGAQLVAAHQIPLQPKNLQGKIVSASFITWDYIRFSIPNYDHVENFYGAATAYRGTFAKKLRIPKGMSEERVYLYLMAKKVNGFRYCKDATIYYWPVSTLKDLQNLATRSFGKRFPKLDKLFGFDTSIVYHIPTKYKVKGVFKSFFNHPFETPFALFLNFLLGKLRPESMIKDTPLWDIVFSTKRSFCDDKKKKKIIISSYDDIKNPYYGGGGSVAIQEIASRLTNDFDITVITSKYPNSRNEIVDRVKYQRIGVAFLGPLKIGQVIFQSLLVFYVLTKKYDVWLENFTPPFSINFLQLFTKKPVIGLVHMLPGEDMRRKYRINFEFLERLGLKTYKHLITTSFYNKRKILAVNPKLKIEVIPNGVYLPNKKLSLLKQESYFLFIGRIEINQKGVDLLLKAYSKIASEIEQKLYIAGSGDKKATSELNRLIEELGLKKSVVYLGRVNGAKKSELYAKSSFVVVPSRFETFSMVSLEAMSFAKTLVCFDICGLYWIPRNVALKVKPYSLDGLAKEIKNLAKNGSLRDELGLNGLKLAKNYSWDKFANDYKEYLNNVLKD